VVREKKDIVATGVLDVPGFGGIPFCAPKTRGFEQENGIVSRTGILDVPGLRSIPTCKLGNLNKKTARFHVQEFLMCQASGVYPTMSTW
jgi:hypothetical protein